MQVVLRTGFECAVEGTGLVGPDYRAVSCSFAEEGQAPWSWIGAYPLQLFNIHADLTGIQAKNPLDEDWNKVLEYGEKVRSLTYTERANNVAASIFPILEEFRPRLYILPHLQQLIWRAETPAGLARCSMFLNPELQELVLEIGPNFKQLDGFLQDVANRTKLTSFSISSPTSLPDNFTDLLAHQDALEKLVLVAPGALSPEVGRWASSLPKLHTLQLDLTGRSVIAIEGFFDDIPTADGYATPSVDGSSDSGVFSEEDLEIDFTEIKKSSLRLTGDLRSRSAFAHLNQLQLTGEVANIAVFLRHLTTSSLAQLDLVIEDPPDKVDWQDLSVVISERFGQTLQSFRVTATSSSRFSDLVRSTSRAEAPSRHLTFEHFTAMPRLVRLEIDLPESIIFHNADLSHLARICHNLESLKLCPLARFPTATAPPWLTLEGIAPLTTHCKRLHTLAVVLNAKSGTEKTLNSRQASSRSLMRLHVGHSWISDPLHVTILLSHLAPHLDLLKFFHEKNRPGFVEANARAWTTVSEYLPHLQDMRLVERQPIPAPVIVAPSTSEKSIDATPTTVDQSVDASPTMVDSSIQSSPVLISQMVEAKPQFSSVLVEAVPLMSEQSVGTETESEPESLIVESEVEFEEGTMIKTNSNDIVETLERSNGMAGDEPSYFIVLPSMVSSFVSSACKTIFFIPLYIPSRILDMSLAALHARRTEFMEEKGQHNEKTPDLSNISPVCL